MKSEFSERKTGLTDEVLDGGLAQLCRTLLTERSRLVEAVSTERNLRRGQLAAVARRLRQLQIRLRHEQSHLKNELLHRDILLRLERDKIAELEKTVVICKKCRQTLSEYELEDLGYKKEVSDQCIARNNQELCHLRARSIEELLKKEAFKKTPENLSNDGNYETPRNQFLKKNVTPQNFIPIQTSTIQREDSRKNTTPENFLNQTEYMEEKSLLNILRETPNMARNLNQKEPSLNENPQKKAQSGSQESLRLKQIEDLLLKKIPAKVNNGSPKERPKFPEGVSKTAEVSSELELQNSKSSTIKLVEDFLKNERSQAEYPQKSNLVPTVGVENSEEQTQIKSIEDGEKIAEQCQKEPLSSGESLAPKGVESSRVKMIEELLQKKVDKPIEKPRVPRTNSVTQLVKSLESLHQGSREDLTHSGPGKNSNPGKGQNLDDTMETKSILDLHKNKSFLKHNGSSTKVVEKMVRFQDNLVSEPSERNQYQKPMERSQAVEEPMKNDISFRNSCGVGTPNRLSLPETFQFSSIQKIYCDKGSNNIQEEKSSKPNPANLYGDEHKRFSVQPENTPKLSPIRSVGSDEILNQTRASETGLNQSGNVYGREPNQVNGKLRKSVEYSVHSQENYDTTKFPLTKPSEGTLNQSSGSEVGQKRSNADFYGRVPHLANNRKSGEFSLQEVENFGEKMSPNRSIGSEDVQNPHKTLETGPHTTNFYKKEHLVPGNHSSLEGKMSPNLSSSSERIQNTSSGFETGLNKSTSNLYGRGPSFVPGKHGSSEELTERITPNHSQTGINKSPTNFHGREHNLVPGTQSSSEEFTEKMSPNHFSSSYETVLNNSTTNIYEREPNMVPGKFGSNEEFSVHRSENLNSVKISETVEIKSVHAFYHEEPNFLHGKVVEHNEILVQNGSARSGFSDTEIPLSPSRLKISETITTEFEEEGEGWYAASGAGSDEEDSSRHDMYRNNPVLECCNQILLRNVRDGAASPVPKPAPVTVPQPVAPNQVSPKSEPNQVQVPAYMEPRPPVSEQYYETPIHLGNVYESLHSSSTHYEQIQHGSERTYQSLPTTPPRRANDYVEMEVRRIPPAVPPKPVGGLPPQTAPTPQPASEPDYCSISELNLPPMDSVPQQTVPQQIVQVAGVAHIPRLPQVSEIIIPEEDPATKTPEPKKSPQSAPCTPDNYVRNNTAMRAARCIATARSVSSLLGAGSRPAPPQPPTPAQNAQSQQTLQHTTQHVQQNPQTLQQTPQRALYQQPAFDLSQTFEEFKLDECELGEEEENISEPSSEPPKAPSPAPIYTLPPAYEHFLECTGLSNKSLLGSPRNRPLQAPHPPMRPKDVKLRSRLRMSLGTGPPTVKFQQ